MRVVIVGGTGNISTSIVKQLLEKGHDVTCFNRGKSNSLHREARQITGDRNNRAEFERVMQKEKFDVAIDMISYAPEDATSSIAAFRGVKHFIHCSTVCTYGVDFRWLPVSEDHELKPISGYAKGKVAADRLLMEAYYREGFPVTIVKPSTTYGPQTGMLRQIAWDFSWIDRIKKGKPVLICGDGKAVHQFMHVDDAAAGFIGILGKDYCTGQTYNLVNRGFTTWEQYHRTAMKVLGVEAELIGIPLKALPEDDSRFAICREIFAHNYYFCSEKIFREVPEFCPHISLEEGMRQVFEHMERSGMITDSDKDSREDELIAYLKDLQDAF